MKKLTLLLSLLFSLLTTTLQSSVPASGEFVAQKACQLYHSKKKLTNPDSATTKIGNSYKIIEADLPGAATWFRVVVDTATPKERWVSAGCGSAKVAVGGNSGSNSQGANRKQCSTAGLEEGYVFAVSWQPAFCESHAGKPECKVSDPKRFQANNFTLHGLWPNKFSCGTGYGFCGPYKKPLKAFCDYAPVPMEKQTFKELESVMPSAAYGSCLQRHEWYKHGTCQNEWSADGYFGEAMRLLKAFNQKIARVMNENIGKSVPTATLLAAVDSAFGSNAHKRLQISCNNGNLTDIYIALPAKLGNKPLGTLMQEATPDFRNRCGERFRVDPIGQ